MRMTHKISEEYGSWSVWYRFDDHIILAKLPNKPGVYEVRTDFNINRLNGSSPIVTIGRAKDLKERRYKQKAGDTTRYLNRAEKWLLNSKHALEFRYFICNSFEEAKFVEVVRQLEYESQHWELPPGNDRLELAPLKSRINELLGISIEQMVEKLTHKKIEVSRITETLSISPVIINNLMVYFGDIN